MNIIIENLDELPLYDLYEQTENISFIHKTLRLSKPVCYIPLTEEDMTRLNIETLGHHYCTDIITFDYSGDEDFEYNEIYICPSQIEQNAVTYHTTPENEILRVAIHGLLHLSGLNDKTEEEQQKMTEAENYYINQIVSRENKI